MLHSANSRAVVVLVAVFATFNGLIVFMAQHGEDAVPGPLWAQMIGFWAGLAALFGIIRAAMWWVDAGE